MLNPLFGDGFQIKQISNKKKKHPNKTIRSLGFSGTPRIVPSRTLAPPPKVWISKTRPNESEECGWELGNPIWDPKVFWVRVFFGWRCSKERAFLYIYILRQKKYYFFWLYIYIRFVLFLCWVEWGVWMTSKTETSNRSHALSCVLFRSLLIVFFSDSTIVNTLWYV